MLALSRNQSRQLDKVAIEQYGVPSLVLMENAGRGVADQLTSLGIHGPVLICCGGGNNGGDGLVIARHLDLRGFAARVLVVADLERLTPDTKCNYEIACRLELPIVHCDPRTSLQQSWEEHSEGACWIVDALLGTGASGDPRPPLDQLIDGMNSARAARLAVDVPSGLDCQTGQPGSPTFQAEHTCTFATTKVGFQKPSAKPFLGHVHVVDIGIPTRLVNQLDPE